MRETAAPAVVIAALETLGLSTLYAQRAASDTRITWTEAALEACAHDVETSTMRKPANALWSTYLSKGQLPPLPRQIARADTTLCPFSGCDMGRDLRRCKGIHGQCWECHGPLRDCLGQHESAQQEAA